MTYPDSVKDYLVNLLKGEPVHQDRLMMSPQRYDDVVSGLQEKTTLVAEAKGEGTVYAGILLVQLPVGTKVESCINGESFVIDDTSVFLVDRSFRAVLS